MKEKLFSLAEEEEDPKVVEFVQEQFIAAYKV